MLRYAMLLWLSYVLCYVVKLFYVTLCYVVIMVTLCFMLCYVILCCVMLYVML